MCPESDWEYVTDFCCHVSSLTTGMFHLDAQLFPVISQDDMSLMIVHGGPINQAFVTTFHL